VINTIIALGPWSWIIAGMLLMLVELLMPGLFFIWLGLAALVTGLVVAAVGLGWGQSAILFAVLAIAAVFAGVAVTRRQNGDPDAATRLNSLSRDLIGKSVRLDHAIVNGEGRVRIGDTVWRVLGDDAPRGQTVTIVRLEGTALVVKAG
jgi:membrane protein implicated in regulation of membrane protease activity